jgi:hypothetical protein
VMETTVFRVIRVHQHVRREPGQCLDRWNDAGPDSFDELVEDGRSSRTSWVVTREYCMTVHTFSAVQRVLVPLMLCPHR